MKPFGTCGECGFIANTSLEFTQHLDDHACVKRDPNWYVTNVSRVNAQWDDSTAPVVFIHEQTGEIRYPGRSDANLPAGYKREHIRNLQQMNRFEREHGVANERMHYDSNGRGLDDTIFGVKHTY